MKKKMTYFAPETESMEVRVERNFAATTNETMHEVKGYWGDSAEE